MAVKVACIVEGHGEVEAVPIVIHRVATRADYPHMLQITRPIRIPKSKLVKPGEIERAVELAARQVQGRGGVIVVLDSDDECPRELGPELVGRAASVRPSLPVAVVLAKREFESWFLAAAKSIAGTNGLTVQLETPDNPEGIRGAKEWLTRRMETGRTYAPTVDQSLFAHTFNLDQALRAPSFDKFNRDVLRILQAINRYNE